MNVASNAAAHGAEWLLGRLEPDGSLRGATTLAAYYKAPCALLWSGHREAAVRVLTFVSQRFLLASGDLSGAGVPWFDQYRIYPHA
ncbi:MAG: hypothetical protein JNL98_41590, partial [Bryobacterales bacterium]|nr:hypothetical protein [Bryobacterales bacterium]